MHSTHLVRGEVTECAEHHRYAFVAPRTCGMVAHRVATDRSRQVEAAVVVQISLDHGSVRVGPRFAPDPRNLFGLGSVLGSLGLAPMLTRLRLPGQLALIGLSVPLAFVPSREAAFARR